MKKNINIIRSVLIIISIPLAAMLYFQLTKKDFTELDQELDGMVKNMVQNGSIRNCVAGVVKGDGSYAWSGSAGVSDREKQSVMTKDTPVYIASITKLFTATLIMLLHEQGRLSVTDPIKKYLSQGLIKGLHVYQGHDYSNEITVEQLLMHTSGIADFYYERPEGDMCFFEKLLKNPELSCSPEEIVELVRKKLTPGFKPGTDTNYSDTNFILLGKIIENVTGTPLHNAYGRYICGPLKLNNTRLVGTVDESIKPADVFYDDVNIVTVRSNKAYWAEGGLVSTVGDMLAFMQALHSGKIISNKTLGMMHSWHELNMYPFQYGYGTMYCTLPRACKGKVLSMWGHSGSTGSFLYYCPELDIYMAGTVNQVNAQAMTFNLTGEILRAVSDRFAGSSE